MKTKLTLKLKNQVIEQAKEYAADRKISLSKLIENYLDSLTSKENKEFEISPFVKSISIGTQIPIDMEWKELRNDYVDALDKKYQ